MKSIIGDINEKCVFVKNNVLLYKDDAIKFMDLILDKQPEGVFDMIFADPPYFLSSGGVTCKSGKMVCVDKGIWDKSNGFNENHKFNLSWLSRCQKLLKKMELYGFLVHITIFIQLDLLCNSLDLKY